MKIFILVVAGLLYCGASDLHATQWGSYTCKNGIVSLQDTMAEVLKKCGPPSFVSKREEVAYRGRVPITVTIEEWTYNEGPYAFMYLLRFDNGRISRIESLDTGF